MSAITEVEAVALAQALLAIVHLKEHLTFSPGAGMEARFDAFTV